MDVTGMAELSLAGWKAQMGQDLGIRMLRQAAQQDQAVVAMVAAAAEGRTVTQAAPHGAGALLDVIV